jgi:hypothetical protein
MPVSKFVYHKKQCRECCISSYIYNHANCMCVAVTATEVRHMILCEDMWSRFKEDESMPAHVLLLLDEVIG